MTDTPNPTEPVKDGHTGKSPLENLVEALNAALLNYSDKDWNYSRISLIIKPIDNVEGPYLLSVDILDQRTKEGRNELKTLADEVKWGDRHTSELGLLEVVSLRINKALLEITSDEYWNQKRPVLRIIKTQGVARENTTHAILYHITEVAGEEFDNR